MAKFDLDLKKFQHIKSDDKSTTLRHKDGHVLTIAHKSLSPEFQKQLSALAKNSKPKMAFGGTFAEVDAQKDQTPKTPDYHDKAPAQSSSQPSSPSEPVQAEEDKGYTDYPTHLQEAKGGQVPRYEDGGIIDSAKKFLAPDYYAAEKIKQTQENETPAQHPIYESTMTDPSAGKKAYHQNRYAEGGDVEKAEDQPDPNQVRSENPNYQPPFEKVEVAQPEVKPNPYAEMYNNIYSQVKSTNPGLPDDAARQQALNVVESQQSADKSNVKIASEDAQDKQNLVMQENQRRQQIGLEPIPMPASAPLPSNQVAQEQPMAQKAEAVPQQSAQSIDAAASRSPESMLEQGYQSQVQGANKQAEALGTLGKEQADLLNTNLQAQEEAKNAFKNSYQELDNERQAHIADIRNGHIDPNNYWKGTYNPATGKYEGGHSKIMTAIGMIIAGFNPAGHPNGAMDFLKFQMGQNMEAQKANLNSNQNLLSANLHQFGNIKDATDMTRLMQNDIIIHQLQKAAANTQSSMGKAQALQTIGKLQMDSAPLFQNFAMRRAMMNMSQNGASPNAIDHMLGYMRVVNPEMAKEMESRYVPGVGLANVPVPEKVRGDMIAKEQFQKALNDMQMFAQKHSGSLNPATIAEGKTMAANVQNLYRQGINGGVFKQGEQSFINGIIDADPTKFFNSIRVMPKLNEAQRENSASLNILKRNYGLPSPQQQAQPQFKIDKNGVKWQRGPKGEAIRVK